MNGQRLIIARTNDQKLKNSAPTKVWATQAGLKQL